MPLSVVPGGYSIPALLPEPASTIFQDCMKCLLGLQFAGQLLRSRSRRGVTDERDSTPVACPDAVAHPGAEVVEHGHAAVAHGAVLGPERPHNLQSQQKDLSPNPRSQPQGATQRLSACTPERSQDVRTPDVSTTWRL